MEEKAMRNCFDKLGTRGKSKFPWKSTVDWLFLAAEGICYHKPSYWSSLQAAGGQKQSLWPGRHHIMRYIDANGAMPHFKNVHHCGKKHACVYAPTNEATF